MHTKKRWIWTNTTLIVASMLGVHYKYDCTTIAVTSIHLSVYYFYVHLHVHVLYIHVQLSTITKVTALGVLCCFALFVCLTLLASFFLPSHLSFKNMYILGLVFGVIGGFITPAFSFILS